MSNKLERRDFLKTSLAASAAPVIATESRPILGANDQIRIGLIGCGGQGNWDAGDFARQPNAKLVALCDVYEDSIQETLKNAALKLDPSKTPTFKDFRRLLEDAAEADLGH